MNGELLGLHTVRQRFNGLSDFFFGPVLHALLIEGDEDTVCFVLATLTISTR